MTESKPTRQAYSVAEVSRMLGIPRSTVYRVIGRGEFPSVRFGNRIVVPRWAVDALLKPQTAARARCARAADAHHH